MDSFHPSELTVILHSKRANIYHLEYCRIMQKDGRVLYLTESKKENQYFNIPIANTTVLLLGNGTSITQAAMRMLSQACVLVGFCGGGGTPLYMGCEIEWFTPQSEYRPTEYLQGWIRFWFDDKKRLSTAKDFQKSRIEFIKNVWSKDKELRSEGFLYENKSIQAAFVTYSHHTELAKKTADLLLTEAQLTKTLYKFAANNTEQQEFTRKHKSTKKIDIGKANNFLNHGNYLAYGLAASCLWVLGIPHGFAVMHGKTRRGALVFDVADLIKDALVLPWSFICAKENATEKEFRQQILQAFTDHKAMDLLFNTVKQIALQNLSKQEIKDIKDIKNSAIGDAL